MGLAGCGGNVRRLILILGVALLAGACCGETTLKRYYVHDAVVDRHGVIAPWYKGQNGQIDLRIRVAAETMKRYQWVDTSRAVCAGPEYIYNGQWTIDPAGNIKVVPT